jgi:parallel beta-helix repeat protein
MKKFYPVLFAAVSVLCLGALTASAQTTTLNTTAVSGFANNNGSGMVLFNFQNTNPYSVTITDVESIVGTAGATTAELWTRTTPLSGATFTGGISVGTGWTLAASGTFTGVVNTTTLTTQPILTSISVTIPANTTYAIAIAAYSGTSGRLRYHTIVAPNIPATTVSGSGCNILMGNGSAGTLTNTSFGAASAPPGPTATYNNPRAFLGKITFIENSGPCTFPPTAGAATTNPSTPICSGTSVALNLNGNSIGNGQTYTWQKSTDAIPPHTWTNVSSASALAGFSVSPSVTTFYRAAVTCSGVTGYSDSVKVTVNPAFPGGTYTINAAQPTGSGNYHSFADAVSALNCGIAGPVVFNVAAGSGPYNEQVIIPVIGATSAVNKVTFNGNGETITYTSAATAQRATIKLNGADYITLNNLNVIAGGSTATEYGYGVQLVDDADNNTIKNCIITSTATPVTAASTSFAGIVINASSATTAVGTGNSQCDNNTIQNNQVTGGYAGIAIMANGSTNTVAGNTVTGNTVKDFYTFGIKIGGSTDALIEGNDVSRPTRSSLTSFYGIDLDGYCINTRVSKNKLHDPYGGNAANINAAYGVRLNACDATAGNANIISNNMVYSFLGATGVHNGFLNNSSDYASYYYNSVLLDDASASCACAARGFYFQSTTIAGLDIKNNTVSLGRGGTGDKQGIYFEPTSVAPYTIDNNNYYFFAAAGLQEYGHIGTTGYTSLSAWQSGSGKETASQQYDPLFISSTDLHLQAASLLPGLATPVPAVTTDIDGDTRSGAAPAIGADEFPPVTGIDLRPGGLISPAVSASGCYGNETITVAVNNNSINAIDFSVNNLNITVQVSGPSGILNYSASVNSGTLASGTTQNVTMSLPSSTISMLIAGEYTFNITTTVSGDVNLANNTASIKRTKVQLSAGTIASSKVEYCVSGAPQLTATGAAGYSGFKWQKSATSGTGYSDIPGGTTTTFTVPAITQSTYYQSVATCASQTEIGAPEIFVLINNPQITGTTPAQRCGPGTVDLGASGTGAETHWYAAATGGTSLASGNVFTTPTINATTTYYVASGDGGTTQTANHGVPTVTTTTQNTGLLFTLNVDAVLNSVDVYSTTGSGDVVITLLNSSGTVIYTSPTFTVTTGTLSTPQTLTLNWSIPAGTNYKILVPTHTPVLGYHTGAFPIDLGNGVGTVTNGATSTGTTTLNYFIYNMRTTVGCEGSRTAVTATVNTPPALTITPSRTVCNNAIQQLQVTSTIGDFNSYIWSPMTDLYTDVSATIPYGGGSTTTVYVKASAPSAVTYTLTALNTGTTCTNTATSTVTTMPDPTIVSTTTEICTSGGATLTLNPNAPFGAAQFQWQSSSNGVTFSDISGANAATYNPSAITQTTYYKLVLKNQAGVTCSEPAITINVTSPQLTGTTPASRCGVGTVDLLASAPGFDVKWYAAASGGNAIATGNVFTTPVISSNTTYYAAAATPGSGTYAVGAGAATSATYSNPFYSLYSNAHDQYLITAGELNTAGIVAGNINGLGIDITAAGTLPMIDFSMKIGATSATDMTNYVSTTFTTVYTSASLMPTTGLNMLTFASPFYWDGSSNIVIEICHGNPSSTATMARTALMDATGYVSTIHTHKTASTGGTVQCGDNTTNKTTYSVRPKFTFITGCAGPRAAVLATVTPAPALTVTASKTICNNSVHQLQVTSTVSDFNSYIWSPQTDLYTDAAATIPYSGGNASQVYMKSVTAGAQVYTLTATNTATQCANVVTSAVTVMPDPVITAAPTELCVSGTSNLSLSPATGYGAGTLQWQLSTDGTIYNDIATAVAANYTTPTLTQTRYYKMIIKDGAGTTCTQAPAVAITVNNPQVTGVTPGSRCGPGIVTLGAAGSAGATLNWYDAASGGSILATGSPFVTPVISTNTTYYVSAEKGNTLQTYHVGYVNTVNYSFVINTAGWGAMFTANTNCTIESVTVYPTGTGTITIKILDVNNVVLYTAPTANITGTGASTPVVVPVGAVLVPGNYKMGMSYTGVTNIGNQATGSTMAYPFVSAPLTITSGTQGAGAVAAVYYWFYDWVVSTGSACESSRTSVVATVGTPASNAAGASGTTECAAKTIAGSTDYNYTDCDPIAVITPIGASPIAGSVNACVKIDASVQTASTGEPYVQRHYDITPASNPATATSTITLYFLQSEFDAFNTASGFYAKLPTGSSDAAGKASLRITQYNGTGTAPGNYTGTPVQIDPADGSISWNSSANRWEITFSATGSGGFYVHTGKFILPVTGLELKGELSGTANKLSWSTAMETNNRGFEVQRSADGNNFSTLGFVATKADNGNSSSLLGYGYSDARPFAGNTYYRLKQLDKDGRVSYSNIVLLGRKVSDITLSGVYPNPAERELNLVIISPRAEKVTIVVTDLRGKIVMQEATQLVNGQNQQQLNIRSLAAGTYIIKAVCANGCETAVHRFVKQ